MIPRGHISVFSTSGAPTAIFLELNSEKRNQIDAKRLNVKLKVNLPSQLGIEVSLVELKRTLANILQNAIEASYDGGEINIFSEIRDGHLRLFVEDNGKGIPKEHLDKIGNRGFSVGKDKGTGLGLWQVKRFAEEAGGRIEIQSSDRHGTSVGLILPVVGSDLISQTMMPSAKH